MLTNDLYIFLADVLVYRVARSNRIKAIVVVVMSVIFICIHFFIYMPMFSEFYPY